MYKDIYSNLAFHKTAGLDNEYIEAVKYLTSKSEIKMETQIDGDLYLALKKPYDFKKIGKALRVIFDDIDSIMKFLPDDQTERIVTIKKIEKILTDGKFINKVKAKKDKNLLKEAKKISKNQSGVHENDLPEEISKRFSGTTETGGSFIYVYPNVGASMSDDTVIQAYSNYLKSIKSARGGKVLFASETVVFADILRIIKQDGWLILTLTMLAIIIILLLDFRSFKALLFTNIPLIGGAIWMFLVMRIFDVKINYLNAAILPVILGVGIDEGVHIYHRWLEEGKNNLIFIIRTTGTAVFMADFTTAIGFAALMFANYRGLRTMGQLAAIGIMTAFAVAVTMLPALLQILENIKSRKEKKA
jgi:predicted RND superfamily exporter protein